MTAALSVLEAFGSGRDSQQCTSLKSKSDSDQILFNLAVLGSAVTLGDKLPAGSSYLPPTAASTGYGAPGGQPSYGGGNDDYYEDYPEDQQPSYSENAQVSLFFKKFWSCGNVGC